MARRAPPSTKHDLLQAAGACFAEHGLEATKVEDITGRAGIAKGAFYSYFASKEACWKQIVEAFVARLEQAVQPPQPLLDASLPLAERFERWLAHDRSVLAFCWRERTLLGMLMNGAGGAAYAHLLDEFAARAAKNAETHIRALVAEGVYRDDIDPALVASLLGGAYDRLVRGMLKGPAQPDIDALARQTQHVFTRGLFTDDARAMLQRPAAKAAREASPARAPLLRAAATRRSK